MTCKNLIALAFSWTLGMGCGPIEPGAGGTSAGDDYMSPRRHELHEVQSSIEATVVTSAISQVALDVLNQNIQLASGTAKVSTTPGNPAVLISFTDLSVRVGTGTMTLFGDLTYERDSSSSDIKISLAAADLDVQWPSKLISDTLSVKAHNVLNQTQLFSGSLTNASGETFAF